MAASFLVSVPTASAAPADPITGTCGLAVRERCAAQHVQGLPGWLDRQHPPEQQLALSRGRGRTAATPDDHSRRWRRAHGDDQLPVSQGKCHTRTPSTRWRRGTTPSTRPRRARGWPRPCAPVRSRRSRWPPTRPPCNRSAPASPPTRTSTSFPQPPANGRCTGATITGTSAVTHSEPTNTSKDDEASVTLTITGSADGGQALLLFGGHLAVSGGSGITRAWIQAWVRRSSVVGRITSASLLSTARRAPLRTTSRQEPCSPWPRRTSPSRRPRRDNVTATPGQEVEYTVTVTNTGEESGSTSFVDDYDDSLDPGEVTTDPSRRNQCNEGGGTLTCGTSLIAGGGSADVHLHRHDAGGPRGRARHSRLCGRGDA